jgi:intermembrane space import and assembly protein 40
LATPITSTNTSPDLLNPNLDKLEEEGSGTSLEALTSRPRRQQSKEASILASAAEAASTENASTTAETSAVQDLEEEADQQGAFNPETGEINWDCPCLGGMAHGPCGPQFREAFSCFVYSSEEPKGMDCIEKFQGMQECFKEHPDVYKGELDEEDDDGEYDEAMAAEKEELVKEIKERREKAGIEADGTLQKRLLEESPGSVRESTEARPQSNKAPSANTSDPEASKKAVPEARASTESLPVEHEDINEGQKSSTIRTPRLSTVGPTSDEGQELIPKASHDASNATIPDDNKPKP